MAGKNGRRGGRSRNIAMGGMFAALAVVLLLLGGIFPFATFAAPVFAGVLLLPIAIELGAKVALLAYAAASILCFLLVPDRELCLFFVFLFGYYPILQPSLNKIKRKLPRLAMKLLLFNVAVAAVYAVLLLLMGNPVLLAEFASSPLWYWVGFWAVANVVFVVYDSMVSKLRVFYVARLRKRFFR